MFPSKLEQFGGMEVSRQFLSSLLHTVSDLDTSPLLILGRVLLFPVTILLIRRSLIFFFKKLIREKEKFINFSMLKEIGYRKREE